MDYYPDAELAWACRKFHRMDYFLGEGPMAWDAVVKVGSLMAPLPQNQKHPILHRIQEWPLMLLTELFLLRV